MMPFIFIKYKMLLAKRINKYHARPIRFSTDKTFDFIEQGKLKVKEGLDESINTSIGNMSDYMKRTEAIFIKEGIKDVNISISIHLGVCSITATKYINKE
jgi:hypothetical protein